MTIKNKWGCAYCACCEKSHSGYVGEFDIDGIEHVVCGATNKRMDINNITTSFFVTDWVLETDVVTI